MSDVKFSKYFGMHFYLSIQFAGCFEFQYGVRVFNKEKSLSGRKKTRSIPRRVHVYSDETLIAKKSES